MIGQHEGIPNILGNIGFWPYAEYGAIFSKSNVIKVTGANVGGYDGGLGFDASKGETKADGTLKNDVYGKSDHLQTNNITVKYWKRVA